MDEQHPLVFDWERIFDAVPDLVAILRSDFTVLNINRPCLERLGLTKDEAVGKKCYELFHRTSSPPAHCPHVKLLRDRTEVTGEFFEPVLGSNLLVTVAPLWDSQGRMAGCVHTARDVTPQKALELELSRMVGFLSAANAESSFKLQCAMALLRGKTFKESCKSVVEICEKAVGATQGFLALIDAEPLENRPGHIDMGGVPCGVDPKLPFRLRGFRLRNFRTGEAIFHNDFMNAREREFLPEGHLNIDSFLLAPLKSGGRVVGQLGLANKPEGFTQDDVDLVVALLEFAAVGLEKNRTEELRRTSEERCNLIAEYSSDMISVLSIDGTVRYSSPVTKTLLGLDPEKDIEGRSLYEFFSPEDVAGLRKAHEDALGQPGPVAATFRLRRKDGSYAWMESKAQRVLDLDTGAPTEIVAISRDVTERRKNQDLLVQSEKHRAIVDLAAGVAHNFNNLLQVILGCAQLGALKLRLGDAQVDVEFEQIISAVRAGASTVTRLGNYAKSSFHKPTEAHSFFDLSEVVNEAIATATPWWKTEPEKRGARIDLTLDLEPGCPLEGRRGEIFEVVMNLVKNASEAINRRGNIAVSVRKDGDRVVLTVSDTGVGVKDTDLPRLFTPFFTTKAETGTGLRLAVSRTIIEGHGGHIHVAGGPGAGTTFTVDFPLVKDGAVKDGVLQPIPFQGPLRALIIDDMESIVVTLATAMAKYGFKTAAAFSGSEALSLFSRDTFDVVICDLAMPDMNGWEVAKAIKETRLKQGASKIPFIMLTGWTDQGEDLERMEECGVDAVASKPLDFIALMKLISDLASKTND